MKKAISADPSIKLVFLCSPGNPTGTLISLSSIRAILEYEDFKGIAIVDEAYIDFADEKASAVTLLQDYNNLCVTQTLSKSFGLAAIRYAIVSHIVHIQAHPNSALSAGLVLHSPTPHWYRSSRTPRHRTTSLLPPPH